MAKIIGVSSWTLPAFANANKSEEPTAYHEAMRDDMLEFMESFGHYGWFPDSQGWKFD